MSPRPFVARYIAPLTLLLSPFLFSPLSVALGERAQDRAAAGPDARAADHLGGAAMPDVTLTNRPGGPSAGQDTRATDRLGGVVARPDARVAD